VPSSRSRRLTLGGRTTTVSLHASGLAHHLQNSTSDAQDLLLVFDETTSALFGEHAGVPAARRVEVPAGEGAKSLDSVTRILDAAVAVDLPRSGSIVAVGGGALTDTVGLAASLYMRGVRLHLVPTTLLAMVDAAVGGKTGVNYGTYKNMVGTFYPADRIHVSLDALDTLGDQELTSGLAEVVKAGLLDDEAIVSRLEALVAEEAAARAAPESGSAGAITRLRRDRELLLDLVDRAIAVKARVVEQDFTEAGIRAHLNLGHTFAHALESVAGLGSWTHGEAVAWGICRALDLGAELGITEPHYRSRVYALLDALGFHTGAVDLDVERLISAMRHDKKRSGAELRFVLQRDLGDTLVQGADPEAVRTVLGG
jgi:3-dehydroquinate synthase